MGPTTRSRSTAPADRKTATAAKRGKSIAPPNYDEEKPTASKKTVRTIKTIEPTLPEKKKQTETRGRGRRTKVVDLDSPASVNGKEQEEEEEEEHEEIMPNLHIDVEENEERALVIDEKPKTASKRSRKQVKPVVASTAPPTTTSQQSDEAGSLDLASVPVETAPKRSRKQTAKSLLALPAPPPTTSAKPSEENLALVLVPVEKRAKSARKPAKKSIWALPAPPTISAQPSEENLALALVPVEIAPKRGRKQAKSTLTLHSTSAESLQSEEVVPAAKRSRKQTKALPESSAAENESVEEAIEVAAPLTAKKGRKQTKAIALPGPTATPELMEEPDAIVAVVPSTKRGRKAIAKEEPDKETVVKTQNKRPKRETKREVKAIEPPPEPTPEPAAEEPKISTLPESADEQEKIPVKQAPQPQNTAKSTRRKAAEPKTKKSKVTKEPVAKEANTVAEKTGTVSKEKVATDVEKAIETAKETEAVAEESKKKSSAVTAKDPVETKDVAKEAKNVKEVILTQKNGSTATSSFAQASEKLGPTDTNKLSKVFVADIKKMVYKKTGDGATTTSGGTVVQSGTLDFRVTSNNSLYIEMKNDVAMVVDKLKIETEQSFEEQATTPTASLLPPPPPPTATNGTDTQSVTFSIAQDQLTSTPLPAFSIAHKGFIRNEESSLNSTLDHFRKRKAEETVTLEVKPKRRAVPSVSGKVLVFGGDIGGELGLGEFGSEKTRPFPLPFDQPVSDVYCGSQHSIILTSDGKVYTFGNNDECALGRVTFTAENQEEVEAKPGLVDLRSKIIKATGGDCHTAVLDECGSIYYWGGFRDSNGSIGLSADETKSSLVPRMLGGEKFIQNVEDIVSGANFLLFLTQEGEIFSLGTAECGALGRLPADECKFNKSQRSKYLSPGRVTLPGKAVCDKIWAGEFAAFARTTDGRLFAWGLNNYSQLGFAPFSQQQEDLCAYQPQEVKFFNTIDAKVEKIVGGQHHTLALDSEGRVYSFGRSNYGRLGHGKITEDAIDPKRISALEDKVVDISCSTCASFAVRDNGLLYSWGMAAPILGLGPDDEDAEVPTQVKSKHLENKKVVRVAAGSAHCLIVASQLAASS